MYDFSSPVFCPENPFHCYWMVFSSIATHYQYTIADPDICPAVGHCPASKRLCQSRYSRAMSETCFMLNINQTKRAEKLLIEPAFLVVNMGASNAGNTVATINHLSFSIFLSKAFVTALFNSLCNFLQCPVPGLCLPIRTIWCSVHNILQPLFIGDQSIGRSTFGTEGTLARRLIRIAFNIDNLSFTCMYNLTATY